MSIWEALPILGLLLAVIAVIFGYFAFARAELFRLRRHEYWADRFFNAAKPLVAHPETPKEVIETISSINDLLADRFTPMAIQRVYEKKFAEVQRSNSGSEPDSNHSFYERFPELTRAYARAMRAGMLAGAYASWVGGIHARALLAEAFASQLMVGDEERVEASDVRAMASVPRTGFVPNFIRR
jgi:hypothetical protein